MKRRFFQIHLLTLMFGMLSMAGFMWANLCMEQLEIVCCVPIPGSDRVTLQSVEYYYIGWPMIASDRNFHDIVLRQAEREGNMNPFSSPDDYGVTNTRLALITRTKSLFGRSVLTVEDLRRDAPELESQLTQPAFMSLPIPKDLPSQNAPLYWKSIVVNAVVAFGVTLMVMFSTEWFLRRREVVKE